MLRIGVMLDSMQASAWIDHILEQIQKSSFARIELVVLNTPADARRPTLTERLRDHWKLTAFSRYEQWDHQRNKGTHDAKATRDLQPLLEGVSQLKVKPARKGFSDYFSEVEVATIRAAELDVVLRFGFRIIRGEILSTARYGVWSFHHDDNLEYRGGPPLFWEIYEGNPVSGTVLQVLTSELDGGRVLYRSHSATNLRSLHANRNPIYWKTAEFILRRLQDLHQEGWAYLQALPTYGESQSVKPQIYRTPHTGQMAVFLARILGRSLAASVRSRLRGGYTKWFLAMRERETGAAFDSASGYRVLPMPEDRFYADQMLLEHEGKTYLFFEDYRYADEQALISCCELGADGTPGEIFEVLRRPYHLSYPFVFEHSGSVYLIPESRQSGAVELYRAHAFPRDWRLERTLLRDVAAVDATLHFDGRKWWMFVGKSSGKFSTCDELALFSEDSLEAEWREHPRSPLVSDVRRARPAGRLFFEGGKLIRPSQDCAKAYGYGLIFSEVVKLTETEYEERVVGRVEPGWLAGNQGTHTYTRSSRFELIDGNLPKKLPKAAIQSSGRTVSGQAAGDQGARAAG